MTRPRSRHTSLTSVVCFRVDNPICSIIDLRRASVPSAALRRRQADWQRAHDDALRRYCRGAAFVTTSALVKGAVIAIGWLQPWPHPVNYFTTISEAREWAMEELRPPTVGLRGGRNAGLVDDPPQMG